VLTPLFPGSSKAVAHFWQGHSSQNHFRTALILAIALHFLLAIVLPPIDGLTMFPIGRDSGINVFLNTEEETKAFDKNLNQQLPLPQADKPLANPALGSASPELGEQTLLTEQTPEGDSSRSNTLDTTPVGNQKTTSVRTSLRFDLAAIKVFAQQEAVRTADRNPKQVASFKRSFNSRRNYQRRTRAQSYKNRYGDYYIKTRSSVGDICFVQKKDNIANPVSTNTVYFFECGKKPLKLDLEVGADG
jgi:hypothetical protein